MANDQDHSANTGNPETPAVAQEEEELLEAPHEAATISEPDVVIAELRQQVELLTRRAEENWDRYLRSQSELENVKRRTDRDLQNAHKYALEKFIKELLPVMDSLDLGIQAATSDAAEVVKLREGAELTMKQFHQVLERFNVSVLDPVGQRFNPEEHMAMAMQAVAGAEPNTVLKVIQKGYSLHERLLRPAMVIIAQARMCD